MEAGEFSSRSVPGSSLVLDFYTEHGEGRGTFYLRGTAEGDNAEWWNRLSVEFSTGIEVILRDVVDIDAWGY